MSSANSSGMVYPTVSGILIVVAPALITSRVTSARKSFSVRVASMGENSTSSQYLRANWMAFTPISMISPLALSTICSRWTFEVDRKTWIRGDSAFSRARAVASMSFSRARESPAIFGPRISSAICLTDSKSPGEATGKPASITSTCSRANCRAISSFSLMFKLAPGHCSPSLNVVSKIMSFSGCMTKRSPFRIRCYFLIMKLIKVTPMRVFLIGKQKQFMGLWFPLEP